MNGACDQFLPRSRLSMEQDGGIRRRNDGDLLQHLLDGWALADDAFEAALRAYFGSQIQLLVFQLAIWESLFL